MKEESRREGGHTFFLFYFTHRKTLTRVYMKRDKSEKKTQTHTHTYHTHSPKKKKRSEEEREREDAKKPKAVCEKKKRGLCSE